MKIKNQQSALFEIKIRGPRVWRFTSADPDEVLEDARKWCIPYKGHVRPFADIAGQVTGRLTVHSYIGVENKPKRKRVWLCRCVCGNYKAVTARDLTTGQTQSCGCLFWENLRTGKPGNKLPVGESALNQLFYAYSKSSRERGYPWALTKEQFREITSGNCFYCSASPVTKYRAVPGTNGSYIGNGVDRVDNSIGYLPGNIRTCCTFCNTAKASMSEGEFRGWISRAYRTFVIPDEGHFPEQYQAAVNASRAERFGT